MTIYLQKEGIVPVYTEGAAEKLEKKGWVRVDIGLLWAEKKAENKVTSLSKDQIKLLLDEKGISYSKKAKIGTLRKLL